MQELSVHLWSTEFLVLPMTLQQSSLAVGGHGGGRVLGVGGGSLVLGVGRGGRVLAISWSWEAVAVRCWNGWFALFCGCVIWKVFEMLIRIGIVIIFISQQLIIFKLLLGDDLEEVLSVVDAFFLDRLRVVQGHRIILGKLARTIFISADFFAVDSIVWRII